MPDIAIPIVFPDYLIAVNTPKKKVKVPDLLPFVDIFPDVVEIPKTKNKVPELGHAGILFIRGKDGLTKYYEYGRYGGTLGATRKRSIRNVSVKKGHATKDTLGYTLGQISKQSGQGGRIQGAYIEAPKGFSAMFNYAKKRMQQNSNPKRKPYDLLSNSCNHFMKETLEAGGIDVPVMIDPRPVSFIEEIRDDYADLDYTLAGHKLVVESPPASLAANMRMSALTASV